MIRDSWTFKKMTEKEQENAIEVLDDAWEKRAIKGTAEARWEIANAIYYAYLIGLGYDGFRWRTTEAEKEEIPLF